MAIIFPPNSSLVWQKQDPLRQAHEIRQHFRIIWRACKTISPHLPSYPLHQYSPSPVTGSHPGTALKPSVPQPGFVPFVISFKISGCRYKAGFMNPSVLFPALRRCSLMRFTRDAKIGVEALVPAVRESTPLKIVAMLSPLADTSGMLLGR